MKGQINLNDAFIIIFTVMITITVVMVSVSVLQSTTSDAVLKANSTYRKMVFSEKILNSPCTTESRAVFNRKKLLSGFFDCLDLRDVYLRVEAFEPGEGEEVFFRFEGSEEEGSEVYVVSEETYMDRTRFENGTIIGQWLVTPIILHENDEKTYNRGVMEMVIG